MKKFKTTAVFKRDMWCHFGVHPKTASLYGDKVEEIKEVELEIHEDQTRPSHAEQIKGGPDYWAWVETGKEEVSLVQPQMFMLNMCFTYGFKPLEERGEGTAYRMKVREL